eukprot:m.41202 g.41202  ORF g.41202 m.41202 type:complete len:449 (+) comp9744_c0_seq1:312-1658(+)
MQISRGQVKALAWIYFAYVCCYLNRKNYPLLLPYLERDGLLSPEQAGIVASIFEFAIGAVKFGCGFYVDAHEDPARLLSQCVLVAGGACMLLQIFFTGMLTVGGTSGALSVLVVSALWSINGAGQAVAWPALARVFMNWFPDANSRGFWYSVLATNQNFGGTLVPRVFPFIMSSLGWEAALSGPAVIAIAYSLIMWMNLDAAPHNTFDTKPVSPGGRKRTQSISKDDISNAASRLLFDVAFVSLCVAYIPVMMIRMGVANWTAVIFSERGLSASEAGMCMAMLEFGAFFGGLLGGYVSDKWLNGQRGPVMCGFSLMCAPLGFMQQILMRNDPSGANTMEMPLLGDVNKLTLLQAVYFLLGVVSFPPHSLIGLTARELVPERLRSTAGCVAKAVGQIGAAAAGWPLLRVTEVFGWEYIGSINIICSFLAALAFASVWNVERKKGKAKQF